MSSPRRAGLTGMTFSSAIQLAKRTATGIPVPAEVVEALGAGRRPAVRVTAGGYTYRSTVASLGDGYRIPLSAEHRAAAGLAAGDPVGVTRELDTEPRGRRVAKAVALIGERRFR
jgi:hypothetical protein